ncbi:MAG: VRR-NUC domain-containing protein [Desulfobacterales bacterium]
MKESDIQRAIIKMLKVHPKVGWVYVTSAGYVKGINGGRMFRVGVPGMSDIMGQMNDGRLLAIEVKVPGKFPTEMQSEFLDFVKKCKGIAFWADSVDGVTKKLEGI